MLLASMWQHEHVSACSTAKAIESGGLRRCANGSRMRSHLGRKAVEHRRSCQNDRIVMGRSSRR